jgi:ribosomal protein L37AE/L43A
VSLRDEPVLYNWRTCQLVPNPEPGPKFKRSSLAKYVQKESYLCHECGCLLVRLEGRMLWCAFCSKRREKPTHPALIVTPRPEREAVPPNGETAA